MGQDYYVCESCKEPFGDYGDYKSCECGKMWCSDECASNDGFEEPYNEDDEIIYDEQSCNYCRGEAVEEEKLLEFALELLNIDKPELLEKYKAK